MKARKCLLWLAFSLRVSLSWLLLNRLCVAPFTGTASPTSWWKIAAVVFLRVAAHVGIFTVAVGASTTTCFTSWLIVDQYLLNVNDSVRRQRSHPDLIWWTAWDWGDCPHDWDVVKSAYLHCIWIQTIADVQSTSAFTYGMLFECSFV